MSWVWLPYISRIHTIGWVSNAEFITPEEEGCCVKTTLDFVSGSIVIELDSVFVPVKSVVLAVIVVSCARYSVVFNSVVETPLENCTLSLVHVSWALPSGASTLPLNE